MTTDWQELDRRRQQEQELRKQREAAAAAAHAAIQARLEHERVRRAEFEARLRHQQEQAALEAKRRAQKAKTDADEQRFDRWPQPDWHLHGEADGSWSVHPICDDKTRREEPQPDRAAEAARQRLKQQIEAEREAQQRLERARDAEQRARQLLEQQVQTAQRTAQKEAARDEQLRLDAAQARARLDAERATQQRRVAEHEASLLEQQERRTRDEARREAQRRWQADDEQRRSDAQAWRKRQEDRQQHQAEAQRADEARCEHDAWWRAEDERRRDDDRLWQRLDDKRQRELAWRAALGEAQARDTAQWRADADEKARTSEQHWQAAQAARERLAEARRSADAARAARDAAWQEHEDTVRLKRWYRDDLADAQRDERERRQRAPGAAVASDRAGAMQRERFKREWLDARVRRGWPAIGDANATQRQVEEAEQRAHDLADAAWLAEIAARQTAQAAWADPRDATAGEAASAAVATAPPVGRTMVEAFERWMRDPTLVTYPEKGARGFWLPDEIAPWFGVGGEIFARGDHLSCTTATFLAWVTAFGRVFEGATMLEPLWVRPKSTSRQESLMRDVYWIWQREYERVGIDAPYLERKGAIDVLVALGIGHEIESVHDIERFDIVQTVVLSNPKKGHSSMVFDAEKRDGRLVGLTLISANKPRGGNPIRLDHCKGWRLRKWLETNRVYIGRFDTRLAVQ